LDTGRTGKESAADGLADYLEERSQVQSSSLPYFQTLATRAVSLGGLSVHNGMPLSERREWRLILPRIFFTALVIPVDLMTFQTKDIRSASRSWQLFRLATLSMPYAIIGLCRYRQASFSLPDIAM
jgi:hypothetical protein